MANLFAGLESLGITGKVIKEDDLYKKKEEAKGGVKTKALQLEDFVYPKQVECPICDKTFYHVLPKQRMSRLVKTDTDLKPYFEPIEPLYYDIMLCSHCGYAAISSTFKRITERQMDKIREQVTAVYQPKEYSLILSPDEAIERYKMALYNCVVKESRAGEKAYVCLKTAWIYRDKMDLENELLFLRNAFSGFEKAFTEETFPICGLDEITMMYILADIARRIGEYEVSMRYISRLIVDWRTSARIKDRAQTVRQMIRDEQHNADAATQPPANKK